MSAILRCLFAGILLYQIPPALFFSVAGIVPVLAVATTIFKRISQRNWGRVAECRSRFTAHLVETVSGVRVIKQSVQEEANYERYRKLVRAFNDALIQGNMRSSWFAPLTAVLNTTGMGVLLGRGRTRRSAGRNHAGRSGSQLVLRVRVPGPPARAE